MRCYFLLRNECVFYKIEGVQVQKVIEAIMYRYVAQCAIE